MNPFTTAELTRMKSTQVGAMQDICVLQTFTDEADDYNQLIRTWSDSDPIACGFDPTGGREITRADATVVFTDASVRLPIDTEIDPAYRVKILTRFGEEIPPTVFGIIGTPQRGPSGLVLNLQKVLPSGGAL